MNELTYSGDGSVNSENNIKSLLFKIFIFFLILSFIIFLFLNITEVRMFNSLNLSMTLVSAGGFLPTNSLENIINTNPKKIVLILSLLISVLNFFLILNIFEKKILEREHKEDLYLLILSFVFVLLVYFNDYSGLDIIISVLSSLSNSGLSLLNSDNNLGLYFLLITALGGSLISNSSGIKLMRIYILLKTSSLEIIKLISPNTILNKNIFNTEKNNR